jgi:hypothetical protein
VITLSILVSRRAAAGLITATLLAIGGAGCSGAAPAAPPAPLPPTTASTSAELCTAVSDFHTAPNQLTQVDAVPVGLDGVKAALQNLDGAGSEVADAAASEHGPQVDELHLAVTAQCTTIEGLQNQVDLSSKLGAIATSVSGVEKAAAPIVNSAKAGCPAS